MWVTSVIGMICGGVSLDYMTNLWRATSRLGLIEWAYINGWGLFTSIAYYEYYSPHAIRELITIISLRFQNIA